ncbi:YphA family membrane protein [Robertmurraya sp. Marseille-Q9965]
MEGFFFYWLFWMYWIMATFFMEKNRLRLQVSIGILLAITLSTFSFAFWEIEISYTCLFLLIVVFVWIARQNFKKGSYMLITSFILMLSYTVFQMFELFDPVWLIFDRTIMLSLLMAYLSILLHSKVEARIMSILAGSILGDILYSFILRKFTFPHSVGDYAFFDFVSISIALLLIASGFKKLSVYFESHFKQFEREKQKQS